MTKYIRKEVTDEMVEAARNEMRIPAVQLGLQGVAAALPEVLQAALDAAPTVEVTINSELGELEKLARHWETKANIIADNSLVESKISVLDYRECAAELRVVMKK